MNETDPPLNVVPPKFTELAAKAAPSKLTDPPLNVALPKLTGLVEKEQSSKLTLAPRNEQSWKSIPPVRKAVPAKLTLPLLKMAPAKLMYLPSKTGAGEVEVVALPGVGVIRIETEVVADEADDGVPDFA
ncbi:hypothetical protein ACFVYV_47490 [Streptomyces mirabilis]|uniref:hypothetical protein n=1 Tax=Streptomyces mirabilis TaxID=68239 RepID=UPI0036DF5F95